jgi:hypothetical protein
MQPFAVSSYCEHHVMETFSTDKDGGTPTSDLNCPSFSNMMRSTTADPSFCEQKAHLLACICVDLCCFGFPRLSIRDQLIVSMRLFKERSLHNSRSPHCIHKEDKLTLRPSTLGVLLMSREGASKTFMVHPRSFSSSGLSVRVLQRAKSHHKKSHLVFHWWT